MRVKGLDLNLLSAFDALIEERNTSRAAERLHLSQPAASAALARLRDFFKDPLLTLHGKRMMATAYALDLHPTVKEILSQVDGLIARTSEFDPANSDRLFRIAVSDYLSTVLFAELVPKLTRIAPNIRLDLQPPADGTTDAVDRGEIDLMLSPDEHIHPDHPRELLFEEAHVVAGWAGNPVLSKPVTEDEFFAAGHIAVEMGRTARTSFAETQIRELGRKRRIEIYASAFSLVPDLIVGTNRLALMHERLAVAVGKRMPIVWQPLPFAFPVMREVVQYHRARVSDLGIKWLVRQIHECVQDGYSKNR